MSHRNARLTPLGRRLLVERVRVQGMPVAHVAKTMGVSRQCAHRWVKRFDQEGVGWARGPLEQAASLA
jgi:transposase